MADDSRSLAPRRRPHRPILVVANPGPDSDSDSAIEPSAHRPYYYHPYSHNDPPSSSPPSPSIEKPFPCPPPLIPRTWPLDHNKSPPSLSPSSRVSVQPSSLLSFRHKLTPSQHTRSVPPSHGLDHRSNFKTGFFYRPEQFLRCSPAAATTYSHSWRLSEPPNRKNKGSHFHPFHPSHPS